MEDRAVVFGAGKIARGFIGHLLYLSGFHTTFIDVNEELISELNKSGTYNVYIVGAPDKNCTVSSFEAYSLNDKEHIYQSLEQGRICFVSVGGKNLESVAEVISGFYNNRGEVRGVQNIVTCENWKDAGRKLHDFIVSKLDPALKESFESKVGVTEAVIMRSGLSPTKEQFQADPTGVHVQDFWYLPIDASRFKGEFPKIKFAELKDGFGNYLTQKMYTNNTTSAVIAYNGSYYGYTGLAEAANSKEVSPLLDKLFDEINDTLVKGLKVDRKDQEDFSSRARAKYSDYTITDTVERHARDPLRKLGPEDRLIGPAKMAVQNGVELGVLLITIVRALNYENPEDPSAVQLKEMRESKGIPYVLKTVCGLSESDKLYSLILDEYGKESHS